MTKPKRARLRRVSVFLLTVVAFDVWVWCQRHTWECFSPDDYAERVRHCAEHTRDVVFIGGSTVAEGVNPDHLGPICWHGQQLGNGYCVGLSGGTTTDVWFALGKSCPVAPRLLVYGITASDINDSRHEPHGVHSLMNFEDVRDWQRTRPDAAEWVTRHYVRDRAANLWNTYRYRHGLKLWAATQFSAVLPAACPETLAEAMRQRQLSLDLATRQGYVPTPWFAERQYDQMKAAGWMQPPFEYLARYRTGSHLKYLERILDWCEALGTAVVLIEMPTTADLEARHPNEFAEFRSRLAEVQARRAVPVLRAHREQVGLDDSHFADLIHLNRAGSDRLSAWVGTALRTLGHEAPKLPPAEGLAKLRAAR